MTVEGRARTGYGPPFSLPEPRSCLYRALMRSDSANRTAPVWVAGEILKNEGQGSEGSGKVAPDKNKGI
jgi:hypothetical protein